MHPLVSAEFTGSGARVVHALEQGTGKGFHSQGTDSLALNHFAIAMEGTEDDVAERAIPFRAGEEVLVTIVEPHMYEVDDAVAKIHGYIVSVRGGGPHVGEKHLVRIEEAGRTHAVAVLVDAAPDGEDDDALDSGARRRGRRGGRRRSAAKATEATSAD